MRRYSFAALFSLLWWFSSWAEISTVPGDYPTIQQALNAAAEHDTVLVAEGTYFENLKFPPINLVLGGLFIVDGDTSHISLTIVDGSEPANPDSGSVIFMSGNQDSSTAISGLTITGGTGTLKRNLPYPNWKYYGGGIYLLDTAPLIEFVYFFSNSATYGGGLYLGRNANAVIRNNQFALNSASAWGGCVRADSCSPTFFQNDMYDNRATYSAAVYCSNCYEVSLQNNWIHHNIAEDLIVGAFVGGQYVFSGNVISDNANPAGFVFGAGPLFQDAEVYITDNQFLRNEGGIAFGALEVTEACTGLISGNLFEDNLAISNGVGMTVLNSVLTISNNIFIDNTATSLYGVTIYLGPGSMGTVSNNIITGSFTPGGEASAVYTYTNLSVILRDNNIFGNSPPAVDCEEPPGSLAPDATYNWWGDASGPYNPVLNPDGLGDEVGDGVLFNPWLAYEVNVENEQPILQPSTFRIYPPFPNPFNGSAELCFDLPQAGWVRLEIFDIRGCRLDVPEVRPLAASGSSSTVNWFEAGIHEITLDFAELPSGIYICWITVGEQTEAAKVVLLR